MPLYCGEQLIRKVYVGDTEVKQVWLGELPLLSDLAADFLNVQPAPELVSHWGAASSGDAVLVPVSNGADARVYARARPGELAVPGALRTCNLLPDLDLSRWSGTRLGAAAMPVLTPDYGQDPLYGGYGRIILDRGPEGGVDFSWAYRLLTPADDTRRHTTRVSAWLRLASGRSAAVVLTRGLGVGVLITVTRDWQRFSFDFDVPSGAGADVGIGFVAQGVLGSPRVVDLLISMNDISGPQVEELSDNAPEHEYLSPTKSYGFAATGVKYYPQLPTVPLDFSLEGISYYDFFDRADTSPGSIGTSPQGLPWSLRAGLDNTNQQPPSTLGHLTSHGYTVEPPATTQVRAVYAFQHLRGKGSRMGAVIRYTENKDPATTGPNGFVWTLAMAPQDPIVLQMLHFGGTHLSWFVELWIGGKVYRLGEGGFHQPLRYGSAYYIEALVTDRDITVTLPGVRTTFADRRAALVRGPWCFWEHFVLGPSINRLEYLAAWASEDGQGVLEQGVYEAWQPRAIYPTLRPLPQSTQGVRFTTDPSQPEWAKTGLTVVEAGVEPQILAQQSVWKLVEDTSSGGHAIRQSTGLGAEQQTVAAILKADERSLVRLRLANATEGVVAEGYFDISRSAGVPVPGAIIGGAGMIDDGLRGDNFTISVTGTPAAGGNVMILELLVDGPASDYQGDGKAGVLCYYMGAEAGPAFSAPVVTGAAPVARSAELPSLGAVALGNEWTLMVDVLIDARGIQDDEVVVGTGEASGAQLVRLMADGRARVDNGTTQLDSGGGLIGNGRHRIAVRKQGPVGSVFIDGPKRVQRAFSFGIGSATPTLSLGSRPDGTGGGTVRIVRGRLWGVALSDAALSSMTAA